MRSLGRGKMTTFEFDEENGVFFFFFLLLFCSVSFGVYVCG